MSERLTDMHAKIEADIEAIGVSIVWVHPDETNNEPSFAYTIGASLQGLSEALVCGFSFEDALWMLNLYFKEAKAGNTTVGGMNVDVFGTPCYLLSLTPKQTTDHLRVAASYLDSAFDAIQIVLPDRAGYFPWDTEVDNNWKTFHKLFAKKPTIS